MFINSESETSVCSDYKVISKKHSKFYCGEDLQYFCKVKKNMLYKKYFVFDNNDGLRYSVSGIPGEPNVSSRSYVIRDDAAVVAVAYACNMSADNEKALNSSFRISSLKISYNNKVYLLIRQKDNKFILKHEDKICFETAQFPVWHAQKYIYCKDFTDSYLLVAFYCLIQYMLLDNNYLLLV